MAANFWSPFCAVGPGAHQPYRLLRFRHLMSWQQCTEADTWCNLTWGGIHRYHAPNVTVVS